MKIKFNAIIKDGAIFPDFTSESNYNFFIRKFENYKVLVEIDTDVNNYSREMRNFFEGVVVTMLCECMKLNNDPQFSDREYVREVLLKKPFLTVNAGTEKEYIRSTTSLKKGEFWQFINNCLIVIGHFGGTLDGRHLEEYYRLVNTFNLGRSIEELSK